MTKEEIIERLNANIKAQDPFETFYLWMDKELEAAMESYPTPFELVEPILEIIEQNPDKDLGSPGDLVHFVEQPCCRGYEELLLQSVERCPTPHNIWMLHRCFNVADDPLHQRYADLAAELMARGGETAEAMKEFDWDWE